MLDTREKAEKVIMGFQTSALTLIDVEPNPIEELELDHRNFVCLTSFASQEVECESPLGLRTLSNGLNSATALEQTRAYIRSQLSSGGKPGTR